MNSVPSVAECEGDYTHDARKHVLHWNLPVIDTSNKAGSMEFSVPGSIPSDFFPLEVSFVSKHPYADLKLSDVVSVEDEESVKFSHETLLYTEKYEIV